LFDVASRPILKVEKGSDSMACDTLIRVLGPIDVVRDGVVQNVGGRHVRALLGALVLAADHVVPVERLESVMWGDAPPPSADDSLHTYVSRLRQLLGPELLERDDGGYRLVVTRDQIDALRFEDLFAAAEAGKSDLEQCARRCRDALALWRGDPFGDLVDDRPFRLEAMRLDELRIATMELALECELGLGRTGTVVAELEIAVQEYPYRERLWYLLIDALARDSRRVEALRAGQRLRAALAEVGLGPSDELRELEDRILHATTPRSERRHRTSAGPSEPDDDILC
jgi:DNA-binding SARP family transcriptional activator